MNSNNQQKITHDLDLKMYWEFLKSWKDGSFRFEGPVYGLVRNQAVRLKNDFNRNTEIEVDDLIQTGLLLLSRGQYEGNCSLGGYIYRIIRNDITATWKKTGMGKVEELTAETPEPLTFSIMEEVFRRILSEEFMREMIMSRPELQREIAWTIVEYDGEKRLSRAEIIRRLEKKGYKRYPLRVAFQQLQQFLCQFRQ